MLIWLVLTVINLLQIEAASLQCYNSSDDFTVTSLKTPLALLNSPFFDINRKTVFYAFGYGAKADDDTAAVIRNAYINNVDANFVLLDWEEEASVGKLGIITGYLLSAVPNSKKIGGQLGEAILQLEKNGMDLSTLHLVGHSLGAHLMGYAGKKVKEEGKMVGRLTGLDPAGPLYSGLFSLRGIEAGSAAFVDAVHTSPGFYGTNKNVGKVDIWVNCNLRAQPGCENRLELPFGLADLCSHDRATLFYAESLSNPKAFPAIQASSCTKWNNNYTENGSIVYIGENIYTQARGNFYLKTNSEEPFGMGDKGIQS